MDSAVNQAVDQANQTNNEMMWLFLAIFVFAPILFLFIYSFVWIATRRKCPECGSKLNKPAIQTIKSDNKVTTKRIIVCAKCGHEFTA